MMAESGIRALLAFGVVLLAACGAAGQSTGPGGAQLFARHCASCHGQVGEGDGPVAAAMVITVPNLRSLSARSGGDFPRDAVMRYIDGRDLPAAHGDRVMPVWGDTFAATGEDADSADAIARERISAIADFVEQLQN
jgi:mono/diheme cytochrome c family protein